MLFGKFLLFSPVRAPMISRTACIRCFFQIVRRGKPLLLFSFSQRKGSNSEAEDSYEYIVTNLPAYAFSLSTIKNLYNLRWNEETAFRHLKYAGNMVHIHSLKKEFYIQEIFGKLTMYNFSSFLSQTVSTEQTDCNKYTYNLNHTQLQKICTRFLKGVIQDVSPLIQRFLVPVRPDRKFKRNLRRQSADTLGYR